MSFDFEQSHNVTDAVIYCRVSSKSQTERGDGLQSQRTRCQAYADYKGYTVKKAFTDDLTGRKARRKGLDSLIAFLQADRKHPHVVIVDDLTRFARNVKVHFELRDMIARAGGILESPTIKLTDDADGELHEYILASVAQHQSRKNAEQSHNRMQARLMNGYWVFSKPKGYKYKLVKGRGKMLFRDEPIASILQEALEGFASGRYATQSEFKRFLESQPHYPKDLPNGEIRYQRISQLLTQPLYAGYLEAPKWGISFRKAQHESLISLETYQKNQARLKEDAVAPIRKGINLDFALRGFVQCGDCERPLTAGWSKSKTGKKHPYYRCYNSACVSHQKSIRRDLLEGKFEAVLKTMQPSEELFTFTKTMMKAAWQQRTAQLGEITARLKLDMKDIEKQSGQLLKRIVETDNTTVINAYENKIDELEKQKLLIAEKLSNKGQTRHGFDEMFELAMRFLANPDKIWASGHIHLQKLVLRLGFKERMTYHRETGCLNPKKSIPFNILGGLGDPEKGLVGPVALE